MSSPALMFNPVPIGTLSSTYASRTSLKLELLPGVLSCGASSPKINEALKPASHLSDATGLLAAVSLNLLRENELSVVFHRYASDRPSFGWSRLLKYDACTKPLSVMSESALTA